MCEADARRYEGTCKQSHPEQDSKSARLVHPASKSSMSTMGKVLTPTILLAFALAGCHSNSGQNASQAQQEPAQDPATANLANANYTTTPGQNPPPPPADQSAGAPADQGPDQGTRDQAGYGDPSSGYDDTAYDVASEPPPSIPDYEQPLAPGDDYEWTPGYWGYASDGYYWVPGAWVLAPYIGALWTPGYWGWDSGRYHWHGGYWGPHVGFYGGVNYGYGYDGDGYEGGYWQGRDFYYNRAITRVNSSTAHHVYDYRVTRTYNNSRVSYNGGQGGLNYRPTQAQEAARNERHIAPLAAQHSFAQQAMQNRGQFAKENHGRPSMVAESQPVNDGRSAPAARAEDFHPSPSPRTAGGHVPMNTGPATPPIAGRAEPNRGNEAGSAPGNRAPLMAPRPTPGSGIHPQPGRPVPESRPATRPESRPQTQPESRPAPNHQNPQPSMESRPVPNPRPQPENRQEQRSQPPARPQPEVRQPQSSPEQRPESRPAPQPESRPEQPRQESRPAPPPKQEQHPQSKPDEKHPQ